MLAAMVRIEPAREEHIDAMQAYLASRGETCMFIRSNLAAVGLRWSGESLEGQYLIAWRDGAIVGVVAHYWNGMVLVQADAALDELAIRAVRHSGRPVTGFSGATDQVRTARAALGLTDAPAQLDHDETLMALALDALVVPSPLARGELSVRPATPADRDPVIAWRVAYFLETKTEVDPARAAHKVKAWFDAGMHRDPPWIARVGAEPVAMCAFNARVPDTVQVGAVYTPPELRNRGYARAVVAGALLDARAHGVARAILFTPRPDALAAYRAIGFEPIGQFTIVLLA
jgi:predicted GNAT family acetyltransferase